MLLMGSSAGCGDYGRSQLDQLLKDRPSLAPILQKHESLKAWIVDAFDGKFAKSKIRWRNADSFLATHLGGHSYDENGHFVFVSDKVSPIDQLVILIYECISVSYQRDWDALFAAGASGKFDRRAFIFAAFKIEDQVSLDTKKVLEQHLKPTSVEIEQAPQYKRVMDVPEHFDDSLIDLEGSREGRDYYGSVYDGLVNKAAPKSP
jgi:hypothetical protein